MPSLARIKSALEIADLSWLVGLMGHPAIIRQSMSTVLRAIEEV